ncbi:Cam interacting protein 111 [Striga asiatica]|uniref:Cam interacting protein 111 n=1 Tax=Striga asiatica TaxID=4170 RepID=A0A5A7R2E1_STRAF|nr:Cam interacting protein 111 [Striga asiatica]
MPSKKKNSKTPLKPSNSDGRHNDLSSPSAASSSVSSPFTPPSNEQLLTSLDEAAEKYPSLISRAAFIGNVLDDVVPDSRSCRVWLSEPAMVSSSIAPGSLVSVSLSAWDKAVNGFPLSSLSNECARRFGFELADDSGDEPGIFFALATVFPSCKVLKNGVRLSLNLSYSMGSPASGRTIFVNPLKCLPSTESRNNKQNGLLTTCISLENCKELYLYPVCLKGKVEMEDAGRLPHDSSPRTPSLSDSTVNSPRSTQSRMSNHDKSSSKTILMPHASMTIFFDMEEVIRDESSRKLLETCTASWLNSRRLLPGNLVVVPVLSGLCVFRVVNTKRALPNSEFSSSENHDSPAVDQDIGKDVVAAFLLEWGTKVRFLLPGNSMVEASVKSSTVNPDLGQASYKYGSGVVYSKLGGLSKEFAVLRDIIVSSAVQSTVASLGLRPTKGVLLHGPPGTGKTTLARVCVHEAGVNMFSINGPEIISQYHGETEQALNEVFENASKALPAVVFIDELDAIAPARKDGGDELSQRMVATLLNLMDGISRKDGLLIIAATNRPDSIEPALRRPGRLDREIEIGVPSSQQRYEILLALLNEMEHSLSDKNIQDLAMATHGFVGADLAALCNEAALMRLRQYVKSNIIISYCDSDFEFQMTAVDSVCQSVKNTLDFDSDGDSEYPRNLGDYPKANLEAAFSCTSDTQNSSDELRVTSDDFEKAKIRVRPSAMREVILEIPKVSWDDVGGQEEVKLQLMEAVLWPQKHKEAFERVGTRPPTGILLFGPPGCSKTLLARAVASEAGLNFLAVKGPELFSKWVGESEKAVRSLFAKARANAPSIVFFDEIDGLAVIRGKESDGISVGDRVISQLLVELDGNLWIIAKLPLGFEEFPKNPRRSIEFVEFKAKNLILRGLQQRGSVTVIAATNRPDKIDPALLRPGRFDRLLYVGPPSRKDREAIFRVHLHRMPCTSEVCISELSLLTEGCTGADISLICREAAIAAIEENLSASEITMEHLRVGIKKVQPSNVGSYEKLSEKFQRLVHSTAKEDDSEFELCSSKPSHIALWTRLRSAVSSLFRLPGFILKPRSS